MISQRVKVSVFLTLQESHRYTAEEVKRKASLPFEPLDQYLQRKKKLAEIEACGEDHYPHNFDQTSTPAHNAITTGRGSCTAPITGETVTAQMARDTMAQVLDELKAKMGQEKFNASKYPAAGKILVELITDPQFHEFLTLDAYRVLA